ncbi:MAG: hypothetical protein LC723_11010, partial [Actinobacteria bacterium]|nr:hypothetical protein [Actinomycetota bacterium]
TYDVLVAVSRNHALVADTRRVDACSEGGTDFFVRDSQGGLLFSKQLGPHVSASFAPGGKAVVVYQRFRNTSGEDIQRIQTLAIPSGQEIAQFDQDLGDPTQPGGADPSSLTAGEDGLIAFTDASNGEVTTIHKDGGRRVWAKGNLERWLDSRRLVFRSSDDQALYVIDVPGSPPLIPTDRSPKTKIGPVCQAFDILDANHLVGVCQSNNSSKEALTLIEIEPNKTTIIANDFLGSSLASVSPKEVVYYRDHAIYSMIIGGKERKIADMANEGVLEPNQ